MIPIVTADEMRRVDAAASLPYEVLVERAGAAVARAAVRMMGGTYGRVVVVIAGKGSNGADGRVAARRLAARGARVAVVDAAHCPPTLARVVRSPIDLVVDAAYGTGFRGTWRPPDVGGAAVLAVDLPSGVDADSGESAPGGALAAARTVTFAALKPGLLFGGGRTLAGETELVDAGAMGLDEEVRAVARAHVVERRDVVGWLPARAVDGHKWQHAVRVVAGSPGMTGAAWLACAGALRSGSGMVHLSAPGGRLDGMPVEVVQAPVDGGPGGDLAGSVLSGLSRFGSLVVGPGLGTGDEVLAGVRALVSSSPVPVVVDGDGLAALAGAVHGGVGRGGASVLVTPHDGEFERLTGTPPGAGRLDAARHLAGRLGCTVLLKGPATVVAEPGGSALVAAEGDRRLATAGTGDVLAGIAGALLAQGLDPLRAGAAAAWVHGRAGRMAPPHGMIASDVVEALPALWAEMSEDEG